MSSRVSKAFSLMLERSRVSVSCCRLYDFQVICCFPLQIVRFSGIYTTMDVPVRLY